MHTRAVRALLEEQEGSDLLGVVAPWIIAIRDHDLLVMTAQATHPTLDDCIPNLIRTTGVLDDPRAVVGQR